MPMRRGSGPFVRASRVSSSSQQGRLYDDSGIAANEPVGIVIRDGGDVHRTPRILMWFWASEEEANNEEEWRERK